MNAKNVRNNIKMGGNIIHAKDLYLLISIRLELDMNVE